MRTFILFLFIFSTPAMAYNPEQVEHFKQFKYCESCDFNQVNLSPELLGSEDYSDAILSETYMYGSSIEHLHLPRLKANGLIAVGLMLHDNDLTDADFSYAELPSLKMTGWNKGDRIRFTGSSLDHAHFSFTVFDAPDFSGAAMRYVSLYRAQWPRANLSEALLHGADLTFANLTEANLEKAILTSAVLSHVDLSRANLLGAQITENQLKQALSLCDAVLPDGRLGECRSQDGDAILAAEQRSDIKPRM
jgi:uncharacterized protein YjbI with pentapeptide repeats